MSDSYETFKRLAAEEHVEVMGIVSRLSKRYPKVLELAKDHADGMLSLADFRERCFQLTTNAVPIDLASEQRLGMTGKELSKWSWRSAIMSSSDPRANSYEKEVSATAQRKYGL